MLRMVLAGALLAPAVLAGPEDRYARLLARLDEDDADGHYRLGLWCERNDLEREARMHFEKAVSIDPDHAGARKELGYQRYEDRWVTARERTELEFERRRAAVDETDPKALFALAEWCKREGLYERASELYARVLELDPEHRLAKRALGKAELDGLRAQVAAYVLGEGEARAEALEALRRRDRIREEEVDDWILFVRSLLERLPKHDGSDVATLHHPRFPIRYRLLGRKRGKNLSLLVFLHGGGPSKQVNDQQWEIAARHANAPFDLIAIPRVWDDTTGAGWTYESGSAAVEAMIREIVRTYPVDTNRVYLAGYSMGGYGTSFIGSLEADRFAALGVAASGMAGPENPQNLLNTPLTVHIGKNDPRVDTSAALRTALDAARAAAGGGYVLEYVEHPAGHQLDGSAQSAAFAWMAGITRDPNPGYVVWHPFSPDRYPTHKRCFHWLLLDEPRDGIRIDARIEDNTVRLQVAGRPEGLSVLLGKALVDLGKPVTVLRDGKTVFRGRPPASLVAIVESYAAREDPHTVYTHRVEVR